MCRKWQILKWRTKYIENKIIITIITYNYKNNEVIYLCISKLWHTYKYAAVVYSQKQRYFDVKQNRHIIIVKKSERLN